MARCANGLWLIGPAGARSIRLSLVLVAALTARVDQLSGQGWIEPRPGPQPADWNIEKLRTSVTVRVNSRVAEVVVEEWFRNNGGGLGEGDYVHPLPGEAVFAGYSLYQGDVELRGELMDAARAREIYEAIVRAQRDPALIELIGKGMLRARVFPIEPGQTRKIQMRYTQVLDRAGDALQFRYAAGIRNTAGAVVTPLTRVRPEQLPTRTRRSDAPLTFTIVIDEAARYRDAFSPTHEVRTERNGGRMVVTPRGELSGDFAVLFPFAERAVGVTVLSHRPAGEDGYFMLTLSPGEVAAASRVPRDLTVVIDVSGSMSGEKMEQARRAVTQLIGTLGDQDRLRLIAFSNSVRQWRNDWTQASRGELREARGWVEALRAEGGTNIHDALSAAFRADSPPSRLPLIVFMTDGLPTNGETRPDHIAAMAETARGRARIFAFGVGYDVNTYLLDRLSEAARGGTQYVRPEDDVEAAVGLLAAKIRHPVLTDLALIRGSASLNEVYPRELPDLFAGEDLVLLGRFSNGGQATVGVSGRRDGRDERYATRIQLPQGQDANDYIPRLWAARKLGDLDRRIRSAQTDGASGRQVQELIGELRQTALRYGLLSEYTSYLVQEPGVVAQRDAFAPAAPPAVTGQAAVARADEARRAREVASVAQVEAVQNAARERIELNSIVVTATDARASRVVSGRTFTLTNGTWQDAAVPRGVRVVEVASYSSAYFALLRTLPELEPVLRELTPVVIGGRRVAIRIADGAGLQVLSDAALRALRSDFR